MKEVIEKYRQLLIQIATPQSTGTGFFLKKHDLIVTNFHVVQGNREVVVQGEKVQRQLVEVVFADSHFDLAFLRKPQMEADLPAISFGFGKKLVAGDELVAVGHPYGLKFSATQGIVSNPEQMQLNIPYIHHDAALNPGNSGGPLINRAGEVVGVNTFIIKEGNNIGFSLPVEFLEESIQGFKKMESSSVTRCDACTNLVSDKTIDQGYCPTCGAKVELPGDSEIYEPVGIGRTIESILKKFGCEVPLTRMGPDCWEIRRGSAKIVLTYEEKNSGLISADAWLAELPKENIKPVYEFLLRENYRDRKSVV